MKDPLAIVILAAGLGTRMKSKRAKVLHCAGGRTLIEHAARTAREAGHALAGGGRTSITPIYVVVGHQAEAVMHTLRRPADADSAHIGFIQQTKQLGTGHALLCGRKEIEASERLLVFCGDTPLLRAETLAGLVGFHTRSRAAATVMTAEMANPAGYGRIVRGSGDRLLAIVEHKSATPKQRRIREINTGVYCFESAPLVEALRSLKPDRGTGEYFLTDVIALLKKKRKKVAAHKIDYALETMGINDRAQLAEADAVLRTRKTRELMLAGVTIYRPETVEIDADVEVGTDTVIEPGAALLGGTRIGEGCRIGRFSVVADSELADHVTIAQASIVEESKVASGAVIGPFARLRMNCEIGADARIGNFVEVKKTKVGRGTKAQHLTYLGDATLGENVNIGAGTITCNYDGEKKHATVIEDNVFIGSGTELVAPVRVGRGAYVGAGSTINQDVPPDSLAIARAQQVTKAGWVRERKAKKEKTTKIGAGAEK